MITSAERNAVEAAIETAYRKLEAAYATAHTHRLDAVAERLEWALDFTTAARDKLPKKPT